MQNESDGDRIWTSSAGPGRGATPPVTRETETMVETSRPRRVLIVEDDADSRQMLSLFLSQHGYEVDVASSLTEGLNKLERPWDVVLSDLGLPDGSGLEIGRKAARLPRPPEKLIAFTGYGTSDDIQATRDAGFQDHVVKPIDPNKLLQILGGTLTVPTPSR